MIIQRHAREQTTGNAANDSIRSALRPVALAVAGVLAGCGGVAVPQAQKPAAQAAEKVSAVEILVDEGPYSCRFESGHEGVKKFIEHLAPLVRRAFERVLKKHRELHETHILVRVHMIVSPDGIVRDARIEADARISANAPLEVPSELTDRLKGVFMSLEPPQLAGDCSLEMMIFLRPEGLSAGAP
jgi:hypothetical protein